MRHAKLAADLAKFDESRVTPEYATHLDAWQNGLTGIGTERDKVTVTQYQGGDRLAPALLEDLYHNDDVAARICDLMPETSLREPFVLADSGLQKEMDALCVRDAFEQAWVFGRLHGGGPIIVGGAGGATTELKSGVTSLFNVDRYALYIDSFYRDTNSPKYGWPETYRVVRPTFQGVGQGGEPGANEIIHESRVIVFPGARTSPRRKMANGYWDDSVLQRVYQVVQAYGLTWGSVIHLLQDAAQGVYAMKDLWNMIVGGNKDAVEQRMALMDEQRSSARLMLVDAENESFNRVPTPFGGVAELIDRISERLASASGYPLTVLMGSSPAGMNATGKSDLELYYGRCEVQRRRVLTPAVIKLAAAMGKTLTHTDVTYPPLWMPTADEVAKTRYATAQADNLYNTMGLPADVIFHSRFRENGYSPEMHIPLGTKFKPPIGPLASPPAPAAPASGGKGKDGSPAAPVHHVAEDAGTFIGSRHFSPKYGR